VQKAQTESGKRSLPTEKEFTSRHLCLHTTDQSYAQDSANLQQYVLLRNKLVTQVVMRATESFNLHCNNVARQVEEKCCPYYRTFNDSDLKIVLVVFQNSGNASEFGMTTVI